MPVRTASGRVAARQGWLGLSLVSGHSTYMQILYHRVRRGQKIAGKFGDTSMSERGSVRYGCNTGNTIPAVVDIKS